MERKEYKLDKETTSIKIKTFCYDISVYTDNIESPIVLVKGNVDIKNDWNYMRRSKFATIEEKLKTVNNSRTTSIKNNGFFCANIVGSQTVIISNDGNIVVNGSTITEGEAGSIELVVPKGGNIASIEALSKSGDIRVRNLNIDTVSLGRLIAETISGDISLEEFQAMYTRLATKSGDINAEIFESMVNYIIETKSTVGSTKVYSEETKEPQFTFGDKYHLDVNSISGDIKVLFKGK